MLVKQAVLQTVKTGEGRVLHAMLVVVFTGVDAGIQIGKQFGNGLDALVVNAGRCVQLLGTLQVAGLDGIGELTGVAAELLQIVEHIKLVVGNRVDQILRCHSGLCLHGNQPEGSSGNDGAKVRHCPAPE